MVTIFIFLQHHSFTALVQHTVPVSRRSVEAARVWSCRIRTQLCLHNISNIYVHIHIYIYKKNIHIHIYIYIISYPLHENLRGDDFMAPCGASGKEVGRRCSRVVLMGWRWCRTLTLRDAILSHRKSS